MLRAVAERFRRQGRKQGAVVSLTRKGRGGSFQPSALPLALIHTSAWKGNSRKSGYLIGPVLIHVLGSFCITTTCSPLPRDVCGLRSHPRASQRGIYAGSGM